MIRVQPERFLRGTLPDLSWSDGGSRLPPSACRKLTADTVRAARVPAGLHLAFTGAASTIALTVRTGERTTVPAPTLPEALVVHVPGRPSTTVPLLSRGPGTVRIELPDRDPARTVRVFLPEAFGTVIDGLAADACLEPAPRGPLWVVYGDSITQGWSVSQPGLAWPSLVADQLGLDLVNLGFAGAARGELPVADVVAASGAAAVTVAWGTNAWSSLPTSAAQIAETTRLFLTAVRQGLPDAPVTVVSPIVRPDAEGTPNRFGARLTDLREALESAVRAFAADAGDRRLTLVPGSDLVPAGQLVDGIHPGDEGHRSLARGVTPHVAAGVGLPARRTEAGVP
ncbi:GDSL-type esterase/lipase family protein [Streptomyces sp. NBC_01478]|uniref:SGNH/GDSL hydrolase family protein n=1 Tax=Streptomyces sp. NBC_01478 TaxID=2903882 RepID=UPI002E304844|nr:SGNH/GDSL hydrolase family protein [Streptomyces sp. NBC_01478]